MDTQKYTQIKKTQVHLISTLPFYYRNANGEFRLYKEPGIHIENERLAEKKHPALYIQTTDKEAAIKELSKALNYDLARSISEKGLKEVRASLCRITEEAFTPGQEKMLDCMPDTFELLLERYAEDPRALKLLTELSSNSAIVIEHTVNVVALTLQYCFFHRLEENEIRHLFFCAFMHDIGASLIDNKILESKHRLTEKQYRTFQEHTTMGHDLIIAESEFDVSIATVALEHHERIDGSGYPNKTTQITADSQLIGIIDCFEPLTFRDKNFRKAKRAYDSLTIIKDEVKRGRFDKILFKDFIRCLIR